MKEATWGQTASVNLSKADPEMRVFVTEMSHFVERLGKLNLRVGAMRDRLRGPIPEPIPNAPSAGQAPQASLMSEINSVLSRGTEIIEEFETRVSSLEAVI